MCLENSLNLWHFGIIVDYLPLMIIPTAVTTTSVESLRSKLGSEMISCQAANVPAKELAAPVLIIVE